MSHETYSFGQYTGIVEDDYNQQLTFNFGDKRKIKETVIHILKKQIQKVNVESTKKQKKQSGLVKVVNTTQLYHIIQSIYDTCIFDITYCTCNLWSCTYYSIIGLVAIFSASVVPIAVMGVVLETGKLITFFAWLYHYWKKVNFLLKTYLISAVIVLMFITSMGIFGFLSKAHIEQTSVSADNTLQIEAIDLQISRQQKDIERAELQLTLVR